MCGRLVNLDTVARVLAEYYHLKTDIQFAALDEALSKVPAVSVVGGHGKDHVADPGKMVGDVISRQAAIEVIEAGRLTKLIDAEVAVNGLKALPPAQQWIPCSERLPETSGQYYVSGGGKVWICEFLIISTPIGGRIGGWCNNAANPIVQAWCPLPEPWKGEQDG